LTAAEELRAAALVSKAWPYEEARKLLKRYPDGPDKGEIVFETGYGPSGLPHLGTFQEVARTLMVRHALTEMVDWPSRLIAFSDDMDGMRKVPPGVPQQDMMHAHLDQPLSRVPDPYGCGHESYAAHNNNLLRQFLDRFGFDYEFLSSSDCYREGRFDAALRQVLRRHDAIMEVMLPTLREERRQTYSPVLPVSPHTGKVLQVPVEIVDAEAGLIRYADPETGEPVEQSALGGGAKLQWKVDWAMRWYALGVDYEMSGKDLIDSVTQSSKIVRILGARPPEGFNYELFLDENGEKISKTRGNGVTIDQWLTYAPEESLAFYIYREPKRAKQLSFGIIPRAVDEYYQFLASYPSQPVEKRLGNPVHHVHSGSPPGITLPITFSLLLNIVSASGTSDRHVIWGMLEQHLLKRGVPLGNSHGALEKLISYAIQYFEHFIAPSLHRRAPRAEEIDALNVLDRFLSRAHRSTAERIQFEVYEIGKKFYPDDLRHWFKVLYETLLGTPDGPRMGNFIAWYGIKNTRVLIKDALEAAPVRRADLEAAIATGVRRAVKRAFRWSGNHLWPGDTGAENLIQVTVAESIARARGISPLIHLEPTLSKMGDRLSGDNRRVDLALLRRSVADRYYCVIEVKKYPASYAGDVSKICDIFRSVSSMRYGYLVTYFQKLDHDKHGRKSLDSVIEEAQQRITRAFAEGGHQCHQLEPVHLHRIQDEGGVWRAAALITRISNPEVRDV
jgi:lysyl-tRNA synthetase class 1